MVDLFSVLVEISENDLESKTSFLREYISSRIIYNIYNTLIGLFDYYRIYHFMINFFVGLAKS